VAVTSVPKEEATRVTLPEYILLLAAIVPCLIGLVDGIMYLVEHELAKWRARRVVFPPMRTIEVSDEIPF
jgi:hypothetical protein